MLSTYKSGYQYETSPRKLEPEYRPETKKRKQTSRPTKTTVKKATKARSKKQAKYNYKPIVYIAIVFAMLFTISYRNSLINESYNKKENIKSQVASILKQNEQLRVSIENSLNLNTVEKEAKEQLGMQKLDNNQKIYVDLQKSDYIEAASEEVLIEKETSWFEQILNKLTQIIK